MDTPQQEKKVSFSQNWNYKLNTKCFTTIRRPNPGYYAVGFEYEIYLKGLKIKRAKLVDIQKGDPLTLSEQQARIDTGYSKAETLDILTKMYQKLPPEVWIMTFVTTEVYPQPFKAMFMEAIEKFSEQAAGLGGKIQGNG